MKYVLALAALSMGLSACSAQPESLSLPPIEGALVRGINFNGAGGIEIDGYRWTSESDSKANGMMLREVESIASDLQPKPVTDEATVSMLNGSIAKAGRLEIDQIMYGAEYDVYGPKHASKNYPLSVGGFSMLPFMIKSESRGQSNVEKSSWESQYQSFECPFGMGDEISLSGA